jgi:hypothetical protein
MIYSGKVDIRPNLSYFNSIDVRRFPDFEQTLAAVFLAKRHEGQEIDNPKAERLISEYRMRQP